MPNLTIENVDLGSVILESGEFRDDLLTFTAAGTIAAGTILARDSVSGSLVVYVKGGTTNGNGIPKRVLTYDVEATVAGDVSIRAMLSGSVRRPRLIIAADGDASSVDNAVIDELQDYGIIAIDVQDLSVLDNQ